MSESQIPEAADPAGSGAPARDPAAEARRLRRRRIATVAMVVFVVAGFFLFGSRVPKDVTLRFEVPSTLRGGSTNNEFPRTRLAGLAGQLSKLDGQKVASFNVPTPSGLDGPLSPPVGLQLKNGSYGAHVIARASDGAEVELDGLFEVDGSGEVRVDLRPRR